MISINYLDTAASGTCPSASLTHSDASWAENDEDDDDVTKFCSREGKQNWRGFVFLSKHSERFLGRTLSISISSSTLRD